jgi:hypothetical protein
MVFTSLILVSCKDQPTIPSPPTQYAVIRLGNFAGNIDTMNITIDGAVPDPSITGLPYLGLSQYMIVKAGTRNVVIVNPVKKDTIKLTMSFETNHITTFIFAGDYDKNPDVSLFKTESFFEGDTYVQHVPKAGTANFFFLDVMTVTVSNGNKVEPPKVDFTDVTTARKFLMVINVPYQDDAGANIAAVYNDTTGGPNNRFGLRTFIASTAEKTDTLGIASATVSADKNYFVILGGNALHPKLVIHESKNPPYIQR